MNSNPEFQPPQESSPLDTPIKPVTQGSIDGAPYDATDITDRYHKNSPVNDDQLRQLLDSPTRLEDGREPARELPKPDNKAKKFGKRVLMGFGIGMAAVGIGAGALFMSADKDGSDNKTENLPPFPETNNTAPAVPGGVPVEKPVPGEEQPLPIAEVKFTNADGVEVTQEELSKSVRLTTDKYPDAPDAVRGYIPVMESMMNYLPEKKQVNAALGYTADHEPTKQDYLTVASMYHDAHDSMYKSTGGQLYTSMRQLALSTAGYHYDTKDEPIPYRIDLEISDNTLSVTAKDNSTENSVEDDLRTLKFRMSGGSGMDRTLGEDPAWLIAGDTSFTSVKP